MGNYPKNRFNLTRGWVVFLPLLLPTSTRVKLKLNHAATYITNPHPHSASHGVFANPHARSASHGVCLVHSIKGLQRGRGVWW